MVLVEITNAINMVADKILQQYRFAYTMGDLAVCRIENGDLAIKYKGRNIKWCYAEDVFAIYEQLPSFFEALKAEFHVKESKLQDALQGLNQWKSSFGI